MPKKIKTANKKKYKKKINKSKTNKKHNAGVKEYLIDSKIPITQLDQIKLPRDITNKIFTHLAAIKIQDRFNKKYLERIKTVLKMISLNDLKIFYTVLKHFIDSVKTTYEFDDKKTPQYLLNIKPMAEIAEQQAIMLIILKTEPETLNMEFKRIGYNNLGMTIITSIDNIRNIVQAIQNFKNIAIQDYRGAQLGIETQPHLRNTTTRRVDSIIRPPRTTRALAMSTRKNRSH